MSEPQDQASTTEGQSELTAVVRHEACPESWVRVELMIAPDGKQIHAVGGDKAPGEGDQPYLGWEILKRNIEPDYKRVCEKFTEIVAAQLHYLEGCDKIDLAAAKAEEIVALSDGSIERYQSDPIFNAKVKIMVANLMNSLDA